MRVGRYADSDSHTSCNSASHRDRDAFRGFKHGDYDAFRSFKHLGASLASSREAYHYRQACYPVHDGESE